jgi:VWFA-related protein
MLKKKMVYGKRFVIGLILVILAVLTAPGVAQTTQPTPRPEQPAGVPPVSYDVDVSLVEVDAVVTDADGKLIRGLQATDFQVFEDGKLQKTDRVSFVEIPIQRADRPTSAPATSDVQSNVRRFDGRLYVLFLDDLHTAAARSGRVKAAARTFIQQSLESGDLAAVVHAGNGAAGQDFTMDRRLLLASIDRFAGRQLRSQTLNEIDQGNRELLLLGGRQAPRQSGDLDEGPRAHDARSAFEAIAAIARGLAPVRGRRKALIWFGEGVSYDMFATAGRGEATVVRDSSRAAIAAASAANVAIYGVDARGLAGLSEETVQMSSPSADPTSNRGLSGLGQELLRSQDNLRRAAEETGGFAVTNTDQLSQAFDRVVEENSAYYLLAYYPSGTTRRDGTFHRLEVKVSRPGARVRARSGYIASPRPTQKETDEAAASMPAALRDALLSPVPQVALPMAVHVAPFRSGGDKASVLVTVEYGAVAFDDSGVAAPDRDRFDSSVIAVDPVGKIVQSDHATITLNVQPETRQAMRVLGFRTHSRLELPPGRYQVRAAALMPGKGLVGSVREDIEVPDYSKSPLSMSGLIVTSRVAGYTPTARFDPQMREVLPAPPSTQRDFRNDEAMALFAEIYTAVPFPVNLDTRVLDSAGEIVFERTDVRTADELKGARNGYALQVSLRQFPPGDYRLTLEASLEGSESTVVSRETPFRVWEVADDVTTDASPAASSSAATFVTIAKGAISGVEDVRQSILRTNAEFEALWHSLSLRGTRPAVEFNNTMVVALFLGSRPTAGYAPEVTAVRRDGDVLVVKWREVTPADSGNPPARTTPFLFAGVPQYAGEVRFEQVR